MTGAGNTGVTAVAPYTELASVYDLVMEHVDYENWASYAFSLINRYCTDAHDVLELGCGTGSLTVELATLGSYEYLATDASRDMIGAARDKAAMLGVPVRFEVADFRHIALAEQFDIALLLYDGINYLRNESDIESTLTSVRRHVRSGGLLIFDQSTPANSLNNKAFFEHSGGSDEVRFTRKSRFDEQTNIHHTTFDIVRDGRIFHEHHTQRAYSLREMHALTERPDWSLIAAFDGFTEDSATESSERIHWILEAV